MIAQKVFASFRRLNRLTVCAVFAIGSALTFAQPTNGCGSGWNAYLVPDSLPLGVCDFKQACDNHDICYGKCLPDTPEQTTTASPRCAYLDCKAGGKLNANKEVCGQPLYVNSLRDAISRKQTCDERFYTELAVFNRDRLVCRAFGLLYREAVKRFGEGAFAGAAPGPNSPDSVPLTAGNLAAIQQFLRQASDDQLRVFVQRMSSPATAVDPSRPLRVDSARGLVPDE